MISAVIARPLAALSLALSMSPAGTTRPVAATLSRRAGSMAAVLAAGMLCLTPGGPASAQPATPAAQAGQATASPATRAEARMAARPLDLRAPDITRIYTEHQISELLAEAALRAALEEVQVQRTYQPAATPQVWSGIAAPVWALLNPLQAWRILAPLPPEQTAGQAYWKPDATAGYLVPAALPQY